MKSLPASPDLAHLKKQAKHLLRDARAGDIAALQRFVDTLPAARGIDRAALAQHKLQLHDAQSVIAREYGFRTWLELARSVEWKRSAMADRLKTWLTWVIEGNVHQRGLALRMLREQPEVFSAEPWIACAIGEVGAVAAAVSRDAGWVDRAAGPLAMPPLAIVTHSRLILHAEYETGLLRCAEYLLRQGANVDATWIDVRFPDSPLSALYGAVGRTHHAGMTRLLLDAGAEPDDNESMYHSVESADPACTQMLLAAGARVTGTNAIARVLDYDRLDRLKLLLASGGDASEAAWIHHAIRRGRSLAHIRALVDAGADLQKMDASGVSLFRYAQMHGRTDVVEVLREHGISEPLSSSEEFVAACTRGDEADARRLAAAEPDMFAILTDAQLQALPMMASVGNRQAVRTMLALGWPREIKAEWDATALNLAVSQGDAAMARLLLQEGADWRTRHGFGDIVLGTLSHGSQSDDFDPAAPRDLVGCAAALLDHGVPHSAFDGYNFSVEVADYLAARRLAEAPPAAGDGLDHN